MAATLAVAGNVTLHQFGQVLQASGHQSGVVEVPQQRRRQRHVLSVRPRLEQRDVPLAVAAAAVQDHVIPVRRAVTQRGGGGSGSAHQPKEHRNIHSYDYNGGFLPARK